MKRRFLHGGVLNVSNSLLSFGTLKHPGKSFLHLLPLLESSWHKNTSKLWSPDHLKQMLYPKIMALLFPKDRDPKSVMLRGQISEICCWFKHSVVAFLTSAAFISAMSQLKNSATENYFSFSSKVQQFCKRFFNVVTDTQESVRTTFFTQAPCLKRHKHASNHL